eukprot:10878747-Ditylum_brightwellii.AAC.1
MERGQITKALHFKGAVKNSKDGFLTAQTPEGGHIRCSLRRGSKPHTPKKPAMQLDKDIYKEEMREYIK